MTYGEKLRTILVNDATVSGLVNSRVFPVVLPADVSLPAIRYSVVSDSTINSLEGYTSGVRHARVQIDCFAKKYLDVQVLSDAVRRALGTINEVGFSSEPLTSRDLYEDESKLFRVSMDFSMWLTEEA